MTDQDTIPGWPKKVEKGQLPSGEADPLKDWTPPLADELKAKLRRAQAIAEELQWLRTTRTDLVSKTIKRERPKIEKDELEQAVKAHLARCEAAARSDTLTKLEDEKLEIQSWFQPLRKRFYVKDPNGEKVCKQLSEIPLLVRRGWTIIGSKEKCDELDAAAGEAYRKAQQELARKARPPLGAQPLAPVEPEVSTKPQGG